MHDPVPDSGAYPASDGVLDSDPNRDPDRDPDRQQEAAPGPRPTRVRLPGFVTDDDIGLGEVVARVTHAFGVPACEPCKRRAATLNRWLVFRGRAR